MTLLRTIILAFVLFTAFGESMPDFGQVSTVHRQVREVVARPGITGILREIEVTFDHAMDVAMRSKPAKRTSRFLQRVFG